MIVDQERRVVEKNELPPTYPGHCPVHGDVDFVRVAETSAYVCPYPPEEHQVVVRHNVDRPPGRFSPREGHR